MNERTAVHSFRGLDDEIEVFRAGLHTDAAGQSRTWSAADLDEIVANHTDADAAPIVVGHPKSNDPAFGWTASVRRDGERLLARFRDVAQEFADAVEAGHFRKRSIRVVRDADKGWRLAHVGFLGAAAPAVPGLAALNYSEPEGESFEFEDDWQTPSILARMMRRMREFLVEKFGLDAADSVMPEWQLDELRDMADRRMPKPPEPENAPSFAAAAAPTGNNPPASAYGMPGVHDHSGNDNGGNNMPDQEAIDAAKKEARDAAQAEFAVREKSLQDQLTAELTKNLRAEFSADVTAAIDRGVAPALVEGMAEFMLALAVQESTEFEFSAGTGDTAEKKKVKPFDFARGLLKRLPATVDLGKGAPDDKPVDHNDAQALAAAALEYVASEAAAGRTVSIPAAVNHLTQGGQ